jgi:hypothetical protein
MPQASSRAEEERVKSNPRSCASVRPTMEAQAGGNREYVRDQQNCAEG